MSFSLGCLVGHPRPDELRYDGSECSSLGCENNEMSHRDLEFVSRVGGEGVVVWKL